MATAADLIALLCDPWRASVMGAVGIGPVIQPFRLSVMDQRDATSAVARSARRRSARIMFLWLASASWPTALGDGRDLSRQHVPITTAVCDGFMSFCDGFANTRADVTGVS